MMKPADLETALKMIDALKNIIVERSKYDETIERIRFEEMAAKNYPDQLERGWDTVRHKYFNSSLERRWTGWKLACKSREISE